MGTKVQYKGYLPGHHPVGDLNDDSNSGTCHVYYGDQPSSNSQFHDSYSKRTIGDAYFGYHTEFVKQKILDHEATFKAQLYDLHRIYRVQRDLMDELKMNELHKQSMALETSMSSCSASQRRSKNSELEILESRPSKIRRKFDHELPADEYIDLEEPKYHSNKPPGNSSYLSNGSCNNLLSSRTNIFLGGSIKIDSGGAGATLNNGENGLADVNEKIQLQEPNSSSLNLVGYDSNILSTQRSKSQVQTFLGEFMQNSHHVREDSKSRNLTMAQKENRREWSHMLDSAGSNGQTTSFSQTLPSEKFNLYNKGHDALLFQTGHIKAEYWKDRSEGVPKHSGIGIDLFNRLINPHQSDKSSSTLKAPWEKSSNCVTPKLAAAEMHPCFNSTITMPQSLQSSGKTAYQNGFYKGSSFSGSGPASCPEADSNYLKRSNGSDVAFGLTFCTNGSINLKGLSSVDASSEKGIDMNIVSIDDRHDSVNRPNRGHVAELPWLKCSMGLRNVIIQPSNSCVTRQINGPGSNGYDMAAKQIMGVPILGESHQSKVFLLCCSALSIEKETDKNGRLRGFDMNLPCKSEENDDKETHVVSGRNLIDLNMCLIEDDAVVTTSTPGSHLEKRTIRGFDLEAPGDFEEEDLIQFKLQKPENSDEDLVTVAAEAIVGIGKLALTDTPAINPPEATTNALKWFVDEISSCLDDADKVLEDKSGDSMEEANSVDYFEYMTLQLLETKEDEYLPDYPKPPKPEEFIGSGPFTTRTRKGQARRGRPRRDFQRDILPGLTSLARHEVTEDLQTFGGLMRAVGHSWPSAFTRDRPRRGRPRLTPFQLPNPAPSTNPSPACSRPPEKKATSIELINVEDQQQSLTGWGKTTRRARRQRCPTGNTSIIHSLITGTAKICLYAIDEPTVCAWKSGFFCT